MIPITTIIYVIEGCQKHQIDGFLPPSQGKKEIFELFVNTFHSTRKLTLNGKIVDAIIRIIDI